MIRILMVILALLVNAPEVWSSSKLVEPERCEQLQDGNEFIVQERRVIIAATDRWETRDVFISHSSKSLFNHPCSITFQRFIKFRRLII